MKLPGSKFTAWLGPISLLIIVAAAYHNSINGPFIFDDTTSIQENTSIRHWSTALIPGGMEHGETAAGRPILNLTLAINYFISGSSVWSYHAGNMLIHFLSALALLGIVRRTLRLPGGMRERFGENATMLAWLAAAIWAAHPLATEAVSYIIQRAESLMALFYLLTLYCFIRGHSNAELPDASGALNQSAIRNPQSTIWSSLSLLFCLLGMATKEVMISAPVMLFLYDRAFLSGSFRETLRLRWRWHAAYALTWIALVALMLANGSRGSTVGYLAGSEITWWTYALTQCWAIVHYLRLSIWPSPLIFDYGTFVYTTPWQILPQILLVLIFVALCFAACWKKPRAGWLGLLFLAVLARTTTIIPVQTQVVAEHRMYLPLAAVVVALVLLGHRVLRRGVFYAGLPVIVLFGLMTFQRNKIYNDPFAMWSDIVQKRPENARMSSNLGSELSLRGRFNEALPYLEKAIELAPDKGENYNNLGFAYASVGNYEKAAHYYKQAEGKDVAHLDIYYVNYTRALLKLGRYGEAETVANALIKLRPTDPASFVNLGDVFFDWKKYEEARVFYQKAIDMDANSATAWNNLGNISGVKGELQDALSSYLKAAALAPQDIAIQDNAARLLVRLGRLGEAIPYLEAELKLNPKLNDARGDYADALYNAGRYGEAAEQYKIVLRNDPLQVVHVGRQTSSLVLQKQYEQALLLARALAEAVPNNVSNEFLLANILMVTKRYEESLPHYQAAVQLAPERAEIHYNYGLALLQSGRVGDAVEQMKQAVALEPNQAVLHDGYSTALEKAGRLAEAIEQEREALRLPNNPPGVRENLDRLLKLQEAGK